MEEAYWQSVLTYNPLFPLLESNNKAVAFQARRDFSGGTGEKVETLWDLPYARKIVRKQQSDGSWKYPGGNNKIRSAENYNQLETFRQLGYLVGMFGFNRQSPVIAKAAEYIFSFQTRAGDIRGILGNQYMPYYTAAMLELLIKAGYADDRRTTKAFDWLKDIRQNDGGWAIPLRTVGKKLDVIAMNTTTLEPDRSRPFSHLVTGVVLRAYAAHTAYRQAPEAKQASNLLAQNLFKADNYPDRKTADYWLRFTFPFWFTDLISAMDSLSLLGHSKDEPQIKRASEWFINKQQPDGTWKLKILKNLHTDTDLWLSLAICRILKRLY